MWFSVSKMSYAERTVGAVTMVLSRVGKIIATSYFLSHSTFSYDFSVEFILLGWSEKSSLHEFRRLDSRESGESKHKSTIIHALKIPKNHFISTMNM